jgi:hypothetical protein
VKYKKKEKIIGRSYAMKFCTSYQHYATYTQGRANMVASFDASSKIPKWIDSGGCRWYTSPEVRNAKYVASSQRNAGLEPVPRCGPEDPNTGSTLCDQPDLPNRGKTVVTYEPGGSIPPCPGGKEGVCSFPTQTSEPAPGSRWVEGPSGEQANVTLQYDYRWALNSGSVRISGSGPCPSAPRDTWKPFTKQIGTIDLIRSTRCTTTNRTYDCCCSCDPAEVPDVAYCTSPTYDQRRNAAIQQAYALLALGMCSAAIGVTAPLWGIAAGAGCVIVGTTMIYGACNP